MNKKNKYLRLLALIIFFALFIRLFAFVQISSLNSFNGFGDHAHYFSLAQNIKSGKGPVVDFIFQFWHSVPFSYPDGLWAPGLAYFIALFFLFFGESIAIAKISIMILSLATIPIIYLLGKEIYNEKIGLTSAFLLAIQPKHIEYAVSIYKDTLYIFLALITILFFIKALKQKNHLYWILTGFFLGLAYLTRYLTLILVASIFIICFLKRKNISKKQFLSMFIALIIVLAPWGIYTMSKFGKPFFSITQHYPYSNGWYGMSYQDNAPTLSDYLLENSSQDIIMVRLRFFSHFFYFLPIWFTPLIFLFFIYSLFTKQKLPILRTYTILLILAFLINFSDPVLFIERGFFLMIFMTLPSITNSMNHFSQKISKFISGKVSIRAIYTILLILVTLSSFALLQWKLNNISQNKDIEKTLDLEEISRWIDENTDKKAIIMTTIPADLHIYSRRQTVMDPYHFGKSINADVKPSRSKSEIDRHNINYLLADIELSDSLINDLNLNLKYKNKNWYFYEII